MRVLQIAIYLCLINGLFCALRKAQLGGKSLAAVQLVNSEVSKAYGKIILDEINKYRKINFFQNKIEWREYLFNQAQQEVETIIRNQSFGDHEQFEKYDEARVNEYFTELAVKLQLADHNTPSKRNFAQMVLSSLTQDYKYQIAQNYSKAGIAAMHSLNEDEYIIVLHLFQDSQKYTCKKALEEGKKPKSISVNIKGEVQRLKCDQQTAGGGWTLIADIDEAARNEALIIPIDDKGLDYHQILFEAKPNWYLNYNFGTVNNWDFDGYNFRFNCLRFGDSWYVDRSHDGYQVKYHVFNKDQDLEIIKPATKCFFGGSQQLYNCAKKFIFKAVPKERLNAFSELQSAANTDLHNNIYHFSFRLYVR